MCSKLLPRQNPAAESQVFPALLHVDQAAVRNTHEPFNLLPNTGNRVTDLGENNGKFELRPLHILKSLSSLFIVVKVRSVKQDDKLSTQFSEVVIDAVGL